MGAAPVIGWCCRMSVNDRPNAGRIDGKSGLKRAATTESGSGIPPTDGRLQSSVPALGIQTDADSLKPGKSGGTPLPLSVVAGREPTLTDRKSTSRRKRTVLSLVAVAGPWGIEPAGLSSHRSRLGQVCADSRSAATEPG